MSSDTTGVLPGAAPHATVLAETGHRFNLSSWTLQHQALVIFILVLLSAFGVLAYSKLAQSEDPPFTFKVMVVRTAWPGATARQVQDEVTDRITRKLQETPDVDFLRSYSRPGESMLFFTIKDAAPAAKVPDTWYQVRKKVSDIAYTLPAGIQGPYFNDEFGDVYTNMYVLKGDGFSPAQLHDYAERLRIELLHVPDVNKVDFIGDPEQRIYVEISNAQLAKLGLTPQQIANAVNAQNAVVGSGVFTTADDRVFVRPSGQFDDVEKLGETLLQVNGRTLRLRDIAAIIPDDRLLIETDAPFLAPAPNRGKRNEPAFVPAVAAQLAAVRGKSAEEIGQLTTANFQRFFQLKDSDANVGWLL